MLRGTAPGRTPGAGAGAGAGVGGVVVSTNVTTAMPPLASENAMNVRFRFWREKIHSPLNCAFCGLSPGTSVARGTSAPVREGGPSFAVR